jgi:hypothetical protein
MMEKMPSSVSRERRRGEMMWMPEKARDCRGTSGAEALEFFSFFGTTEAVLS